jgi:hypothetical protein
MFETRYSDIPPATQTPAAGDSVFDAPLQQLMRADPQSGERAIDFDPVCNCQDFRITAVKSRLIASNSRYSLVEVRFVNLGVPNTLTYLLRRKGGYWKISDITLPKNRSLVGMLGGKPPSPPRQ